MDEPRIDPVKIWAVIVTLGFFAMCLITAFAGSQIQDLKTRLSDSQAVELVQDAYVRGLQARLAEANKLNGALELENITCQ